MPNSKELPNWVCIPDEGDSHLTHYVRDKDGFGGCPEHVIAGGCSIPQQELQALITRETERARVDEIRIQLIAAVDAGGASDTITLGTLRKGLESRLAALSQKAGG